MKNKIYLILALVISSFLVGCSSSQTLDDNTLVVYNAGDYLDRDVLKTFEEETGIKVIYEEFDTNEIMYTKAKSANASYDIICPSDYMIERMRKEKMLDRIDVSKLTNYKNLDKNILDMSKSYDSQLNYSIPYAYGTVGILYDKTRVSKDEVKTWNVLWDKKYVDEILMPDSVRDIMAIALKRRHHSLNSSNIDELKEAESDLKVQKPLAQAYVNDQVKDKMIGGEAIMGVIYSGEALAAMEYNKNLDYYVPDEGSNLWIDAWVIPKTAQHKKNAMKFIDFMLREDIALKNYEYLTYSTPNKAALNLVEDETLKTSEIVVPPKKVLDRCETMKYLGYKLNRTYHEIFMRVKSN